MEDSSKVTNNLPRSSPLDILHTTTMSPNETAEPFCLVMGKYYCYWIVDPVVRVFKGDVQSLTKKKNKRNIFILIIKKTKLSLNFYIFYNIFIIILIYLNAIINLKENWGFMTGSLPIGCNKKKKYFSLKFSFLLPFITIF